MGKQYLHYSIIEILLQRIKTGVYPPETKIPKTKDLARELSTSSVTIDKALSSLVEQGYLSRKAKSGSFITSRSAWPREDARNGSPAAFYSLMMRDSPSPYFWKETIKGIHDAAREQGSHILSCYIDDDPAAAREAVADLGRKGVKGIVFAPLGRPTEEDYEEFNAGVIDAIRALGIPLVLVDRYIRGREASHVVSRDYEAAVRLTEALFAAGARKPVCLTHMFNSPFSARVRGFRDAMKARGFKDADIDARIVEICPQEIVFDPKDARSFVGLLRGLPNFDGVFTVNAVNLHACVNTLSFLQDPRARNVKYVNFDDIGPLNISGLVMTAVQESYRIGKLAGTVLADLISRWPDATFHVVKDYHYRTYES